MRCCCRGQPMLLPNKPSLSPSRDVTVPATFMVGPTSTTNPETSQVIPSRDYSKITNFKSCSFR